MSFERLTFSVFLIVTLLGMFFSQAFAVPPEREKLDQESLFAKQMSEKYPTPKEVCAKYNNHIMVNVDEIFLLDHCSLRRIESSELANIIIQESLQQPFIMNHKLYAALPLGDNFTTKDYLKRKYGPHFLSAEFCQEYEHEIVSTDDASYFYIEKCKKRKFPNSISAQRFAHKNNPIYSIADYDLERFPNGEPMPLLKEDTQKGMLLRLSSETEQEHHLPSKETLCKGINNKVAAFFESFYYVEKCVLRPIDDFSIRLQVKTKSHGGVKELNTNQALGLDVGTQITEKEVLKKL